MTNDKGLFFLHIPKTAGQTVHSVLVEQYPEEEFCPARTYAEFSKSSDKNYKLYSGHLNWDFVDHLPQKLITFTVLRDPCERLASYYFYNKKQAESAISNNENVDEHKRVIASTSPDEYFFGQTSEMKRFIYDHYYNFYTFYFSTRRYDGYRNQSGAPESSIIDMALVNLRQIDCVEDVTNLNRVANFLNKEFGWHVSFDGVKVNVGDMPEYESRWSKLLDLFERDIHRNEIYNFVKLDYKLCYRFFGSR
ncbi:sulfotransferase family 2 domain-containing protein [Labrenzia sp. R4_1]|uniref:sulfotransferase family 2 domain-containing protein n=1 Tax=Labrenzia sp. R4_1 TaxID=2821106 RepID=UPI001ADBB45F|nr:sulfotransferase family 2 domain-containing protein [Labrenzia sp. R4_1]MBO9427792.1 sulfotransferase family 2 domain-containing protein [Labrenzia sp. R4_1]